MAPASGLGNSESAHLVARTHFGTASLRPARPQRAAEPGALQTSCPARSLALVPVASPMVLPGIPDGFPETAHSVRAQRSRVEETDRIPAANEGSRAHPPTPAAPPLWRRPPAPAKHQHATTPQQIIGAR